MILSDASTKIVARDGITQFGQGLATFEFDVGILFGGESTRQVIGHVLTRR